MLLFISPYECASERILKIVQYFDEVVNHGTHYAAVWCHPNALAAC